MSIFRIYPEKGSLIASGPFQYDNASQTSVMSLFYGGGGTDTAFYKRNSISRYLVKFDITELQDKFSSKDINQNKVQSYALKFTNAIPSDKSLSPEFVFDRLNKNISASFDLITYPINKDFDEGRGNDLLDELIIAQQLGNPLTSGYTNWLSATSLSSWSEPGVFINPTASTGFYATQHFSLGSENIDFGVNDIMNDWLSGGSTNYGFGIAYARPFELLSGDTRYISSFYTHKTNSSFKPFIEVEYDQTIKDDRGWVSNNRVSRLFLYLFSGNTAVNFYSAGTVTIKNSQNTNVYTGITPTQLSKGVYYVDVFMSGTTKGQKFKDVWNDVVISPGYDTQTITQSFEIKNNYFYNNAQDIDDYVVSFYGISNNETFQTGEVIRLYIDAKVNYTMERPLVDMGMEYRLIMNSVSEIIPFTPVNVAWINNYMKMFIDIDTSWLLSNQTYEIDFRMNNLGTKRIISERVNFKVTDNFDGFDK